MPRLQSRAASAEEYAELMGVKDEAAYAALFAAKARRARLYVAKAMGLDPRIAPTESEGKVQEDDVERMPASHLAASPPAHFRERTNFRTLVEDDATTYVMFSQLAASSNRKRQQPVRVESFPRASHKIVELMPLVKAACDRAAPLRHKLFEIRFHTTLRGGAMVLLLYNAPIGPDWLREAEVLRQSLPGDDNLVVGRSRKVQLVAPATAETAQVVETLRVTLTPPSAAEEETVDLSYIQLEGEFSQPNARVCEKMLSWAVRVTAPDGGEKTRDLLELYCGNGNFTCALARNFRKVLATEVSKLNIKAARQNAERNGANNVKIARLSADEVVKAFAPNARTFTRLVEQGVFLDEYDAKTVLVDPPRAGLEDVARAFVATFETIVYVSCNPETLARDLLSLRATHFLRNFAVFDQFPYTDHVECGVVLVKRATGPKFEFAAIDYAAIEKELLLEEAGNNNGDDQLLPLTTTSTTTTSSASRKRKGGSPDNTESDDKDQNGKPGAKKKASGGPAARMKRRRLGCAIM